MQNTTKYVCENISGSVLGYCQSDEISILILNNKNVNIEPWFNNRIQKICSISSSLATYYFNNNNPFQIKIPGLFDSRTFIVPEYDIVNYFIWRKRDCIRNSITSLAQSLYSHKFLNGKNSDDKKQLCEQKDCCWDKLNNCCKYGSLVYKITINTPLVNHRTGEITYRKKFIIDQNIDDFNADKLNNIIV